MPRSVGVLISANRATLAELQTIYGVMDLYDLLEIVAVDSHNTRKLYAKADKQ